MIPIYRFADFELDTEKGELRRDGDIIPLQDLPFRLLQTLVDQAPATVSREALREALWPPGTHLDVDASLNTAVARVRDALGDDAGSARFVATVPRKGYRFVASLKRVSSRQGLARRAALLVALGLVLAGVGYVSRTVREKPPAESFAHGLAPKSNAAREQVLIGWHHVDRRSRDGLEKGIASFQSAAAIDSESAEAYSGLAVAYALLGAYDYWRPREAFGPAETMARKALELDGDSVEAHLAMGLVAALVHWDWAESLRSVDRGLALAPDSSDAWYFRAVLLSAYGRSEESMESYHRALELSPISPVANAAYAWDLFLAGRGEEAVAQAHRTIELHPDYFDAWDFLKWIEITLGHEAPALEAWSRAEELDSGHGEEIRKIYRESGLEGLHWASVKSLEAKRESDRYQSAHDIVLEYAALGEVDKAMEWLEHSFAERETDLIHLAVDPRLEVLRGEARFKEILRLMNFPELAE